MGLTGSEGEGKVPSLSGSPPKKSLLRKFLGGEGRRFRNKKPCHLGFARDKGEFSGKDYGQSPGPRLNHLLAVTKTEECFARRCPAGVRPRQCPSWEKEGGNIFWRNGGTFPLRKNHATVRIERAEKKR